MWKLKVKPVTNVKIVTQFITINTQQHGNKIRYSKNNQIIAIIIIIN